MDTWQSANQPSSRNSIVPLPLEKGVRGRGWNYTHTSCIPHKSLRFWDIEQTPDAINWSSAQGLRSRIANTTDQPSSNPSPTRYDTPDIGEMAERPHEGSWDTAGNTPFD